MRYTVAIREIHVSHRDVEADSIEEAVKKAQDGDFDNEYLEYSHTPDMQIEVSETETGEQLTEDFRVKH